MVKGTRTMREGQKKEEDESEKEIMKKLREMRQEIQEVIKRESEEVKQEIKEIRKQLERIERRQETGNRGKEGEGRTEARNREDQESDGEAAAEGKQRDERKERKETSNRGTAAVECPKLEGERREESGWESKGWSKSWWEKMTSEEEEGSIKSQRSSRKGAGPECWRGNEDAEGGKEKPESIIKRGTTGEADSEEERYGKGTEREKNNVWEIVKRREERVKAERERRERERGLKKVQEENEKLAKKRRTLIWSGLEGTGIAERKNFMVALVEMALNRKPRIKGAMEIKGDGNKDLMIVEMEVEEDKKEIFNKRWEMKKRWGVIVDEELTREERQVRWRIEEKARRERMLGRSAVATGSRLWIDAKEIYWDEGRKEWRRV